MECEDLVLPFGLGLHTALTVLDLDFVMRNATSERKSASMLVMRACVLQTVFYSLLHGNLRWSGPLGIGFAVFEGAQAFWHPFQILSVFFNVMLTLPLLNAGLNSCLEASVAALFSGLAIGGSVVVIFGRTQKKPRMKKGSMLHASEYYYAHRTTSKEENINRGEPPSPVAFKGEGASSLTRLKNIRDFSFSDGRLYVSIYIDLLRIGVENCSEVDLNYTLTSVRIIINEKHILSLPNLPQNIKGAKYKLREPTKLTILLQKEDPAAKWEKLRS